MFCIVYGRRHFSWTDHFEYEGDQWYVTFPFAHICYIPLFPCGSGKLLMKGTDSGFRIPYSCMALTTNWALSCPCCCCGMLTDDAPAASEASKQRYIDLIDVAKPRRPCLAESLCPDGHPLTISYAPNSSFGCDVCGCRLEQGAKIHSCRACNYDVCEACQQQAEGSSSDSSEESDNDEEAETAVPAAAPPAQEAPMSAAAAPVLLTTPMVATEKAA